MSSREVTDSDFISIVVADSTRIHQGHIGDLSDIRGIAVIIGNDAIQHIRICFTRTDLYHFCFAKNSEVLFSNRFHHYRDIKIRNVVPPKR